MHKAQWPVMKLGVVYRHAEIPPPVPPSCCLAPPTPAPNCSCHALRIRRLVRWPTDTSHSLPPPPRPLTQLLRLGPTTSCPTCRALRLRRLDAALSGGLHAK